MQWCTWKCITALDLISGAKDILDYNSILGSEHLSHGYCKFKQCQQLVRALTSFQTNQAQAINHIY